jgi:hypothetical protein
MIREKQPQREVIIDLTGPDGNAFALMGYARRFARQLGYSKEDQDQLLELMQSGNYENLLEVFDDHFGSFVILER